MLDALNKILATLEKVKPVGQGRWVARCPAHPDKTPSLSIRLIDGGKILLHCFSGCPVDSVVSAMGMTLADLMPDKPDDYRTGTPKYRRRIPASDLLEFIHHETIVVRIAAGDMVDGKPLSDADLARLQLAFDRLSDAVRECIQ